MAARDVFISYRRELSGGHAGRLFDSLERKLGHGRVFIDATAIELGAAFPRELGKALAGCRVVIVVIAPGWIDAADARGRRLEQAGDWVRLEVESALKGGKRLIPVLVGEARLPRAEELPPELRGLVERQAIDLRSASWDDDVRRLTAAIALPRSIAQAPPKSSWPAYGAVAVGAAVLVIAWTMLSDGVGTPSRRAVPASGPNVASIYDSRLRSLTLTQDEQEVLAQRFAVQGLNVPLLRRFLAIAAAEPLQSDALDPALVRYVGYLHRLQSRSLYDDTGVSGQVKECDDGLKLIRSANFDQAEAAFERGAMLPAKPSDAARVHAAWCRWFAGQLRALQRRPAAAHDMFSLALEQLEAAGKSGRRLRVEVLLSDADLAEGWNHRADALARIEQAVVAARQYGYDFTLQRVLLLAAAQLEGAGRHDDALRRREEALRVREKSGSPGSEERALAKLIVAAYDQAGRSAEASALRERYGLAPR